MFPPKSPTNPSPAFVSPLGATSMTLRNKVLSGFACLWAVGGVATASGEEAAGEFLRVAATAAARVASCAADADDLASEAALRFLKAKDRDDGYLHLSRRYIKRCVDSAQRDGFRKQGRLQVVPELEDVDEVARAAMLTGKDDPSQGLALEEFVRSLPTEEREILELMTQGSSEREICAVRSESRHRIRQRIAHIRTKAAQAFRP